MRCAARHTAPDVAAAHGPGRAPARARVSSRDAASSSGHLPGARLDPRDALSGSGHAGAQHPQHGASADPARGCGRPRPAAAQRPPGHRGLRADRQVPYAYDWQSAGVPWYFPTTAEALRAGRGDCESRAVVLASILTAKGIPNELRLSFDHIWVDYPGKQANALENAGVQFAGVAERALLHPLAQGLPAGTGGPRPAGDLLDAGAGVARAAPRRRPLAHRALERARAAARRRPARRGRAAAGRRGPGAGGPVAAPAPRGGPGAPARSRRRSAPEPPSSWPAALPGPGGCDTLCPHPDVRLKESS